jgi:Ricin-type beta-trefoil lectin domain
LNVQLRRGGRLVATALCVAVLTVVALTAAAPAHAASVTGTVTGPFLIHNAATKRCVDIPGQGAGQLGGPVLQWTCTRFNDNQLFLLELRGTDYAGRPYYWIFNAIDGLCLDLPGTGAVSPGTKVIEYYCAQADNQLWRFLNNVHDGTAFVINTASGLCLDVQGHADSTPGLPLTVWNCTPGDDHEWWFE